MGARGKSTTSTEVDAARVGAAWALSVATHAVVALGAVGVVGWLGAEPASAPVAAPSPPAETDVVVIELPPHAGPELPSDSFVRAPDEAPPPPRSGGRLDPRPDMGRAGRGGDAESSAPAVNLADRDDRIHLERSVLSRLDRDQLPRLRSGAERSSREDWRASREPTELTFLAMGDELPRDPERVPDAPFDPGAGTRTASLRTVRGGARVGDLGRPLRRDGEGELAAEAEGLLDGEVRGAAREGEARASPGLGWMQRPTPGAESPAGRAARARPMVDRADPSVPAQARDRPMDTVDAEQEVATMVQSIVHASTAGGPRGAGRGGEPGGPHTGSGGARGPGSTSSALGTGGPGPAVASAADPARALYLRQVMAKIHPLWASAFPKWAIAEGLQGTAIVTFTIEADGSVSGAAVTRPSGVAEFDANVRAAVLRAAPFGPLPPALGPRLRWSMPFVAKNEAVRPRDPAEGVTPR